VSYNRFVELMQEALVPLCAYLQTRKGHSHGTAFIDSTLLAVCHPKRSARHKVFAGLAQRGRSALGWCYGFKLHLLIDDTGELLACRLTAANIDDRVPVPQLLRAVQGKVFGDRGYIPQALFADPSRQGVHLMVVYLPRADKSEPPVRSRPGVVKKEISSYKLQQIPEFSTVTRMLLLRCLKIGLTVSTLLLLTLSLHSEQTAQEPKNAICWAPELQLRTLTDIENRLARPWDYPLEVHSRYGRQKQTTAQKPTLMTNCLSYFDLTTEGFEASPIKDQQDLGADCYALRALQQAVPAQHTYLSDFHLNEQAVNYLPPDLGLIISRDDVEKARSANAKGLSWRTVTPPSKVTVENNDTILVEGDGWHVRVKVMARGDFNRDGIEDLLVKTRGWLSEGSYEAVRLLLLTRTQAGGRLSLVQEYRLEG
jgi:hypothetical protein